MPASFPSIRRSRLAPQILAAILLVGIAVIGLESSAAARRSILAAHASVNALEARWLAQFERLGGGEILPHIIGGGAVSPKAVDPNDSAAVMKKIMDDGAAFHLRLPIALKTLWILSFAVPVAFVVLSLVDTH